VMIPNDGKRAALKALSQMGGDYRKGHRGRTEEKSARYVDAKGGGKLVPETASHDA